MCGGGAGLRGAEPQPPVHRHSRAFLHALLHSDNTAALHHLTVHNIAYQVGLQQGGPGMGSVGAGGGGPEGPLAHTLAAPCPLQLQLMSAMRASIVEKRFPDFVRDFMGTMYGDPTLCPTWATEALASVGITLS